MASIGYYLSPSINKNNLVFCTDNDVWKIDLSTDNPWAQRLTFGLGVNSTTLISPNGERIAYYSQEDITWNISLISINGGEVSRLTYLENPSLVSWKDDSTLYIRSSHQHFTTREGLLYELNIHTKELIPVNLGPATSYQKNEYGSILLGRKNADAAAWKRYKGGTASTLWIKQNDKTKFKRILKNIKSHISCPTWIGKNIFFISDFDGVGNIYSCDSKGQNIKRHTHHDDYYARFLNSDGSTLTYICGSDIYILNPDSGPSKKVEFNIETTAQQAKPRIIDSESYLQEFEVNSCSSKILITIRGKLFNMAPWSGAIEQIGQDHARYKNSCYLNNKIFTFMMDDENEETLFQIDLDTHEEKICASNIDWGKSSIICPDEKKEVIAITNNRNQLFIFDTNKMTIEIIEQSKYSPIKDLNWSHDGRYLAYSKTIEHEKEGIFLYDLESKKSQLIIQPIVQDFSPYFDPNGDYLYFLSIREFSPVMSEVSLDYSYTHAIKPYAICLRKDVISPLEIHLDFEVEKNDDEDDEDNEIKFEIDFDNIEDRVVCLNLDSGGYESISAIEDKLFFIQSPNKPTSSQNSEDVPGISHLFSYDLKTKKKELFHKDVGSYCLAFNGKNIFIDSDEGLRLCSTDSKPIEDTDEFSRKDGWIDLNRVKFQIDPRMEWKQMYQEAWVLQREYFWNEGMSNLNWEDVYIKYLPLLDRVQTRYEFHDLMWEMQGELGTSHAYSFGGDPYQTPPITNSGYLGADFLFDQKNNSFEITQIYKGDSWIHGHNSPLLATTVSLKVGDRILAIDGISFTKNEDLDNFLIGKSDHLISMEVLRKGYKKSSLLNVRTLKTNGPVLYRNWVNKNREYVSNNSNGTIGYIHVPDMSIKGLSEFFRHYYSESKKEALIIDVRYNGGGHVSQLLLKELQQKVLGFDKTRWFGVETYPKTAVNGPITAITNEMAGSDGDIFSHSFKLMNLGKLIGKRTWGGVIGIWPRNSLNDHGITSQPEFSFWFKDVGYKVENNGTDPDIEVDITPEDWSMSIDTQLDKAISETLKSIKSNPPLRVNLEKVPNLKAPRLPKV